MIPSKLPLLLAGPEYWINRLELYGGLTDRSKPSLLSPILPVLWLNSGLKSGRFGLAIPDVNYR